MVIFAYLLAVFIAEGFISVGTLSRGCVDSNFCSSGERFVSLAGGLILLAAMALIIGLGWKGKLFGARRTC